MVFIRYNRFCICVGLCHNRLNKTLKLQMVNRINSVLHRLTTVAIVLDSGQPLVSGTSSVTFNLVLMVIVFATIFGLLVQKSLAINCFLSMTISITNDTVLWIFSLL